MRTHIIEERSEGPLAKDPLGEAVALVGAANLDVARSIYAAWERGDFSSADWAHSDIEFAFADGPEPGRWTGQEQMSRRYGAWLSGWQNFRAAAEEYFVVSDDRILVFVINSGYGRASGVEFEQRSVANYFEFRDGKVTKLILYWERARALAACGLSPRTNASRS